MQKRDIRLAGCTQGQEEIDAVMRVLNTKPVWNVSGPECDAFQKELCEYLGTKYCVVVNSGSSANLLALSGLNLPKRSYVLTSACGFPASLNPVIHLNHHPVLVDYNLSTLNIDLNQVELMLKKYNKIKAALIAHTLGVSIDMDKLMYLCNKYEIYLIEDTCESMGSTYRNKRLGSFGKVGTYSFYSSHQISAFGMGGCVVTNDEDIYNRMVSQKDWGKRVVRPGYICTKMDTVVDNIPYDKQYSYDTIGYNFRMPDGNAAYGRAQLQKLPDFMKMRQRNYNYLKQQLLNANIPLYYPIIPENSDCCYFGFPIVLQQEGLRDKLVDHLETNGVHVRLFFAGCILRHPAYKDLKYTSLYDNFETADYLMRNALFCGTWQGLSLEDMEYTAEIIKKFFNDTSY